jgi:hypothetical protein
MQCLAIGAQWSSDLPAVAVVHIALFNDYVGITGAEINVDGRVTRLQPFAGLSRLDYESGMKQTRKEFTAPLDLVRSISTSQRAWLRVRTTQGTMEVAIVDGPTDSKALHALRRFIAEVDRK